LTITGRAYRFVTVGAFLFLGSLTMGNHLSLQEAGKLQMQKDELIDKKDEVVMATEYLDLAIKHLEDYANPYEAFTPEHLFQLKQIRKAAMDVYSNLVQEICDLEDDYGEDIREAIGYGR
jgi:hypothetical protein